NLGRFAVWVSEKPGFSEKTWFLSPLFEKDTNRLRQDAKYRLSRSKFQTSEVSEGDIGSKIA
ncbi:MAG: hypothetical protein DRJ03_17610, partial [Chloroflexi bacterium]